MKLKCEVFCGERPATEEGALVRLRDEILDRINEKISATDIINVIEYKERLPVSPIYCGYPRYFMSITVYYRG
jgi:hypothetical protein